MNGKLYKNYSDQNYINKTISPLGGDITLHFKEESEIINPTIYISRDINIKNVNYIYVEGLKRYYYINNIKVEHQRYVLECHVDVLMSFTSEIKSLSAVIERSQTHHNMWLDDEEMARLLGNQIVTLPFPSGFPIDSDGNKTAQFILTLNGGG